MKCALEHTLSMLKPNSFVLKWKHAVSVLSSLEGHKLNLCKLSAKESNGSYMFQPTYEFLINDPSELQSQHMIIT